MHISFMIFQLWVAPMQQTKANPGLKTTLQIGSDLWIKLRVVDHNSIANMSVSNNDLSMRLWAETDF